MGSKGGDAPNPYSERQVSTRFLRVPLIDWPNVKVGRKTEYRKATKRPVIFPYTPTPVVAYTIRGQTYDQRLMVLDAVHQETLWNIKDSAESLQREGFETYEDFRAYWKQRHGTYLPLTVVYVYRVRPIDTGDETAMALELMALGGKLIEHLYGDFLPNGRS